MAENEYFMQALSNMSASFAYVEAIRHLYNLGLSDKEIQKELTYPLSLEKIQTVVKQIEKESQKPESQYTYEQRTDAYGRKSFVRVKKENM